MDLETFYLDVSKWDSYILQLFELRFKGSDYTNSNTNSTIVAITTAIVMVKVIAVSVQSLLPIAADHCSGMTQFSG